jgi:ATP-binding cassette subfamily F protein 3
MATLNTEGAALESRLSTNPHPQEIAEIGRSLKTVNDELAVLEDRWLDLSNRIESGGN